MVEITDEMVERAHSALKYHSESQAAQTNKLEIRAMLTAALNPRTLEPPLPAAQIEAGWQEFVNSSYRDSVEGKRIVAKIYRAMRKMEAPAAVAFVPAVTDEAVAAAIKELIIYPSGPNMRAVLGVALPIMLGQPPRRRAADR